MGMYTKLHCNIKIKKDAIDCIKVLNYMLDNDTIDNIAELHLEPHDLFKTDRWEYMLKSCSFYFTGSNNTKLIYNGYNYVLHCDCDLKNYDDEIELFLDWISKYCDCDYNEFIGYTRYEEDVNPTLLYFVDNKIIEKEV